MLQRAYEKRVDEVMALPHITERHRGVVVSLVRAELVAGALFEWGAANGIVDEETGALVPSLEKLPTWLNTVGRFSQILGLSPLVDRRVVDKGDSLLEVLAGLDDVTDAYTGDSPTDGKQDSESTE